MARTLKELRQEAGLTQLDVAYRLGVTPHTVYMWETGRREPLARAFLKIARLYGVSPFDIALPEPADAPPAQPATAAASGAELPAPTGGEPERALW